MFRKLFLIVACSFLVVPASAIAQQNLDGRIPIKSLQQPFVLLIRDPIVQSYLNLSVVQRKTVQQISNENDIRLLPMRAESEEQATKTLAKITESARQQMESLLTFFQRKKLEFVEMQFSGMRCLLTKEMREKLGLTKDQYDDIYDVVLDAEDRIKNLEDAIAAGKEDGVDQEAAAIVIDQHRRISEILNRVQRVKFRAAIGDHLAIYKLGRIKFKAPELFGDEWLNSPRLTMTQLKGKVIAIHFWSYGSLDCQRNYAAYRNWHQKFADKGLVVLGVHTPETESETIVSRVRSKTKSEKLAFPVLVDSKRTNWDAWGNSKWPSTFLIDKKGYIRYWWHGALDSPDVDVKKVLKKRIEELLAET